jgi:hypothetical protein
MRIYETYRDLLSEVKPSDVNNNYDSVETIVNRLRNIGFIVDPNHLVSELISRNGLRLLRVPSNPYKAYVVYRAGSEKHANELVAIAEKYGGYLSPDASDEDSIKIGQLLNYDQSEIEAFINRRKQI